MSAEPVLTGYVLLLRGINVGGAGKLAMGDLRALLAAEGYADVATYIQSGNAVFRSHRPRAELAEAIAAAIEAKAGFRPALFLLTKGELARALAANPWPEARQDEKPMHLFFHDNAAQPDGAALDALLAPGESWHHDAQCLYLRAPAGIGRSKFAEKLGRHFKAETTARNLRTCEKLLDMVSALG